MLSPSKPMPPRVLKPCLTQHQRSGYLCRSAITPHPGPVAAPLCAPLHSRAHTHQPSSHPKRLLPGAHGADGLLVHTQALDITTIASPPRCCAGRCWWGGIACFNKSRTTSYCQSRSSWTIGYVSNSPRAAPSLRAQFYCLPVPDAAAAAADAALGGCVTKCQGGWVGGPSAGGGMRLGLSRPGAVELLPFRTHGTPSDVWGRL